MLHRHPCGAGDCGPVDGERRRLVRQRDSAALFVGGVLAHVILGEFPYVQECLGIVILIPVLFQRGARLLAGGERASRHVHHARADNHQVAFAADDVPPYLIHSALAFRLTRSIGDGKGSRPVKAYVARSMADGGGWSTIAAGGGPTPNQREGIDLQLDF